MTLNYEYRGERKYIFLQGTGPVYPNKSITMKFNVPVRANTKSNVSLDATGLYMNTPDACYVQKHFYIHGTDEIPMENTTAKPIKTASRPEKITRRGPEICSDGIDNDGNKKVDEGCNYRKEIVLYDHDCDDNTIEIFIDGRSKGVTGGNKRHIDVSDLQQGKHKITIYAHRVDGSKQYCMDKNSVSYEIRTGSGLLFLRGSDRKYGHLPIGTSKHFTINIW